MSDRKKYEANYLFVRTRRDTHKILTDIKNHAKEHFDKSTLSFDMLFRIFINDYVKKYKIYGKTKNK